MKHNWCKITHLQRQLLICRIHQLRKEAQSDLSINQQLLTDFIVSHLIIQHSLSRVVSKKVDDSVRRGDLFIKAICINSIFHSDDLNIFHNNNFDASDDLLIYSIHCSANLDKICVRLMFFLFTGCPLQLLNDNSNLRLVSSLWKKKHYLRERNDWWLRNPRYRHCRWSLRRSPNISIFVAKVFKV